MLAIGTLAVPAKADPPVTVLSGLVGDVLSPVVSADGSWRAVVERVSGGSSSLAAVWRSNDGVDWERVTLPSTSTTQVVSIGNDGRLLVANSREVWRFESGSWVGPMTVFSGSNWESIVSLVSDGSTWVAVQRAYDAYSGPDQPVGFAYSVDGGTTWSSGGTLPGTTLATVSSVKVIGDTLFAVTSNGLYRWSFTTKAGIGLTTGVSGELWSSPGSTSDLWVVSGGTAGGLVVRESTNAGASFSTVVSGLPVPFRPGVTFASPRVLADGKVHLFGYRTESSVTVEYRVAWDPATLAWDGVYRLAGSSSGSALLWRVQPVDGTQPVEETRWVQSSGGSPVRWTAMALSGSGDVNAWPTATQTSSGSTVLSGLVGDVLSPVVSADGSWRAVVERVSGGSSSLAAVWRSNDGVDWERVTLPSTSTTQVVSIGNDGRLLVANSREVWRFESGSWVGPMTVFSGSNWESIVSLVSDGSTWVAVQRAYDAYSGPDQPVGFAYSVDGGTTWSSGGTLPGTTLATVSSVKVIGDTLFAVTSNGLYRWSFTTKAGIGLTTGVSGTPTILPGLSVGNLWLAYGGTGLTLYSSSDNGATWSVADAESFLPGMSTTVITSDSNGKLYAYATAACSNARLVYSVEYDLGSGGSLSDPLPLILDERKTTVLLPPHSDNRPLESGVDAWLTNTNPDGGFDVLRIGDVLSSPEAVYGHDGYGLARRGVNLAIRNFVTSASEASVATVGSSLEVSRSYNSSDQRVGIFGRGWSSNVETRVYENCVTQDVTILHEDGRRETHLWNGSGYVTPPGYTTKLVKTGSTGWTLTELDGSVRTFRTDGRMTSVKDAFGHTQTLSWNGSGQLTTMTDGVSGRALTFTYTSGKVTSVSTPSVTGAGYSGALTWNYAYSGANLTRVCDPRDNNTSTGLCTTYTMSAGRLTQITDPNGHIDHKVGYGGGGIAWEEDGEANRTTYAYPTKSKTVVTDPNGHETTSEFDSLFRLWRVTDALGKVTTHHYNAAEFRDSTTDPNGLVTEWTYDANGNVTSETNPDGETTWFAYDTYHNRTAVRDGRSASSADNTYLFTTGWSSATKLKTSESTPPTTQQPSGTTRSWVYTTGAETAVGGGVMPAGLLKTETDARGNSKQFRYDSQGNLRETTDRSGLITAFTYDPLGRMLTATSYPTGFPGGVTVTTGYDQLGNVVSLTEPSVTNTLSGVAHQRRIVTVYDGASNPVSLTESDLGSSPDTSRVTTNVYDDADRLVSVTDPEGGVTLTEYNAVGNITATVDAEGRRVEYTFDDRDQLLTSTAIDAATDEGAGAPHDVVLSTATYDDAGRQVTATDALGRTTRIVYDDAGRVVQKLLEDFHVLGGGTRDVELESTIYDNAGHPISVFIGGALRAESRTYDEAGMLVVSRLDPTGLDRWTYLSYDANGNVVTRTVTDGTRTEETRATYDVSDNQLTSTVENGSVDLTTSYVYDNRSIVIATIDPRGNLSGATPADFRTDMTLDALGRTVTVQSPPVTETDAGTVTTGVRPEIVHGYNTFGNETHLEDERANTTVTSYDRLGRKTLITHPGYVPPVGPTLTPTESFGYDAVGNLISRTDRRGETTTFEFDGLNRVVLQTDPQVGTDPAGTVITFYDDAGQTITTIDQNGARTESTRDDLGRQRTSTNVVRNGTPTPAEFTTVFDYDDLGNKTFMETPSGDVSEWTFSPASETLIATDALGKDTVYTYDVAGRVVSVTDPLGRSSETEYDLAGRAIAVRRYTPAHALLTVALTGYDAAGNTTSQTTPRGTALSAIADYTTTYSYDAISRLTEVSQPVSSSHDIVTGYGYDAAGNQTSFTDGNNHTTTYTFNPWNLQASLIEPATTATPTLADRTWTTTYDLGGLAVIEDQPGSVQVTRTFDELGRLTSETGAGTAAPSATRSFGYDPAGRMIAVGGPGGTIGIVYDDRGLLTETTGPTQYQSQFVYDETGRITTRSDAAGTSAFTWTPRSELETVADPLTSGTRTNTFDDAGQLTTVDYATGHRVYGYDHLGRVTSDTLTDASSAVTAAYGYGYDPDGNITSRTVTLPGNSAAGTNTYTYDNAGRLATWTKPSTTTVAYTWDDAGNLTNNAGVTATFDERNQILTSGSTTYAWTPRGTPLSTTTGGVTTATTYDGLGRLTASGTTSYSYDSLDRVASDGTDTFAYAGTEIDPGAIGSTLIARSPAGLPGAAKIGSNPAVLLGRDRHGDIGYQFDPTGTVSATRVFDPLGEILAETGTLTTLGYQGDHTDPTTGDVWMGARWYRPSTGTFTSRDTVFGQLQTPISLNRYTYAWANPLLMFDPDGREPCSFDGTDVEAFQDCRDEKRSELVATADSFVSGVTDAVTAPITTALNVAGEAINCGLDKIKGKSGNGCLDTAKATAQGVVHYVTNPTQLVKACLADKAYCVGNLVGGVITGKALPVVKVPIARAVERLIPDRADPAPVIRTVSSNGPDAARPPPPSTLPSPSPALSAAPPGAIPARVSATNTAPRVTEPMIRDAMENAPLQTQQGAVSLPKVQSAVDQLAAGSPAPPIKVDGSIIVDGNHRYIAGQIMGQPPAVQPWAGGNPSRVIPWWKQVIDPTDWPG